MTEQLHCADFAAHVGSVFAIHYGADAALEVYLVGAAELRAPTPGGHAFQLIFQSDRQAYLPQGSYLVRHAALGDQQIFIVPIGPNEQGMRYEAIFSYL
jgi:hypothetical protein